MRPEPTSAIPRANNSKLTQAEPSLVIFFVLAVVAAASVGTYVFVPRFCPKDTQLFVDPLSSPPTSHLPFLI